ncbi:hypothetical protein [Streptomyces chryseus]|uniref:Uncharacterized protein n=1 Tax=Streptomyces chryseus TaxID=68186 RepID=A0ABQ3DFN6_9ACTN|nr:hypothetical protein [Streptomyces chryseus]GHA86520.1 hypothetical protein GCM10010346_06410 [Streptomyces chryseus]
MEREALAGLLTDGTRAATAARAAVLEGGAYTVWDGAPPARSLPESTRAACGTAAAPAR